jgi:hypothetical protein
MPPYPYSQGKLQLQNLNAKILNWTWIWNVSLHVRMLKSADVLQRWVHISRSAYFICLHEGLFSHPSPFQLLEAISKQQHEGHFWTQFKSWKAFTEIQQLKMNYFLSSRWTLSWVSTIVMFIYTNNVYNLAPALFYRFISECIRNIL